MSASPVTIVEDPNDSARPYMPLEQLAVQHLHLTEFFLRVLPHLPTGKDGLPTDEALAYSEWRYVVYLRFLQKTLSSPQDCPPPWDVAMIWYCHLLSSNRFYEHLAEAKHTSHGLLWRQFPLAKLSLLIQKRKWSDSKAVRTWGRFNSTSSSSGEGYLLPYQLWSTAPWGPPMPPAHGQDPSKPSGPKKLSKLFSRKKQDPSPPSSEKRNSHPVVTASYPSDPQIYRSRNEDDCGLPGRQYSLAEYARFRTGAGGGGGGPDVPQCDQWWQHTNWDGKQKCELAPWPKLHDLKDILYRQAAFWSLMSRTWRERPDFVRQLSLAVDGYVQFMRLFRGDVGFGSGGGDRSSGFRVYGFRAQPAYYARPEDIASGSAGPTLRLVPPTLQIDLLWHTHRLFPGCYWPWCEVEPGRLIDTVVAPSTQDVRECLARTRQMWDTTGRTQGGEYPMESWLTQYTPEIAERAPRGTSKRYMHTVLIGSMPKPVLRWPGVRSGSVRAHQSGDYWFGEYYSSICKRENGGGGGGGSGGGYGGGGGDSGGGGGGGDGGGGGGGDGGGC